jgi:hypothetical protein
VTPQSSFARGGINWVTSRMSQTSEPSPRLCVRSGVRDEDISIGPLVYGPNRDANVTRNEVSPVHFTALRDYSDRQIVEPLSMVALNESPNRDNDSVAVAMDQQSVDWAAENLRGVGWGVGKQAGSADEQRATLPAFMHRLASRTSGVGRSGGVGS